MDVMKGFYNRLLNIDLTQKRFEIEAIDQGVFEQYLGGKGLASHILYQRNPPNGDPPAEPGSGQRWGPSG